ncbi:MAG: ArsR family transcriptional regulator [Paenibacillus sp.]|nr:ArsR family transcriptional regulator [Paenibacillus sp.]
MTRDYGFEIDALKLQLLEIRQLLEQVGINKANSIENHFHTMETTQVPTPAIDGYMGFVYYSGQLVNEQVQSRWEPQERSLEQLLGMSSDKTAKILAALGHKQRLDILKEILKAPRTGLELVERLNMGTTGQLYHHLKALTGADLLAQEERGGKYIIPASRVLPLMLLLAAVSDVQDTSDYMDMTHARNHAGDYLGDIGDKGYDVHELLWAVVENTILEHRAGHCTEMSVYIHEDHSITVADNGRGIPSKLLPQSNTPLVQSILTDMQSKGSGYVAPGAEKGISIAVVNALCIQLTIEVRREGKIIRQQYRNGIPVTGVQIVGATQETGTSVTFTPSSELFPGWIDYRILEQRMSEFNAAYPALRIHMKARPSSGELL